MCLLCVCVSVCLCVARHCYRGYTHLTHLLSASTQLYHPTHFTHLHTNFFPYNLFIRRVKAINYGDQRPLSISNRIGFDWLHLEDVGGDQVQKGKAETI